MSVNDFENLLSLCIKKNDDVIRKLNELKEEMEHHHAVCNSVKTVGTTAGIFGTALMVTPLLAAPLTGGASLAVTVAAAGSSIGGAATNIITGAVDRKKTTSIISEAQSLIASRNQITSKLEEQCNLLENVIKILMSNDVNEKTAFYTILSALANGQCYLRKESMNSNNYQGLVTMGRLIQTEFDLFKSIEATSKTLTVVSKAAPSINQMILKSAPLLTEEAAKLGLIGTSAVSSGSQALKTGAETLKAGGQATGGLVKTLATAAVVTSVVISVVDVAFLIRDWASDHPTVEMIQNLVKQLNTEMKNFKNLLSILDQLRERVFFATIENIPIIGAMDSINDAVVALLNQNIYGCIQILKDIDIHWPFDHTMSVDQLIIFLIQVKVTKGFDHSQLKTILQQRGKKARQSIICLVKEMVEMVKAEARTMQQLNKSKQKSSRGEHVINNNVLSVQRDIIDMFLRQRLNKTFGQLTRIPIDSAIYRAYHYPFESDIRTNIESVMVARIPDDIFYFDANALLYGVLVYLLRNSAKDHMAYFYDNPNVQGSPSTSTLRTTRLLMNEIQAYVDQFALQYWLTYNGGNRGTYERSKLTVYRMFLNLDDQIRTWVHELKRFGY